jgi:hypothetical protein
MKRSHPSLGTLPVAAAASLLGVLLLTPRSGGWAHSGHQLGLDQRDLRVLDNFLDPEANDNTTPHPSWPGAVGARLAVWKAAVEWGSALHGDGAGDPSQPGDLGSGGAGFDFTWQGRAPGPGGSTDNVVSALSSCGGGVVAFTEAGPDGWRIRLCDDWLWDDGPGVTLAPGAFDIQGLLAHELGHALGLAHSSVAGSTMSATASGNGVTARSLEADDRAGIQALYGAAGPTKPRIDLAFGDGTRVVLYGSGFAASGNEVWLTAAGVNPNGDPVRVSGLASSQGGTRIELVAPTAAGPGDVLVRIPGTTGAALSNAWPLDPASAAPVTYCTAQESSLGCASGIASSGVPSASSGSGFVVVARNLRNQVPGLLFYGRSGPAAQPALGGLLCVRAPLRRTPAQSSGGSPPGSPDCSGALQMDLNAWIASGADPALVAGTEVYCQVWSRDPGAATGSNLSDALAFVVGS